MIAFVSSATSLVDRGTSMVSELGHLRWPSLESPVRGGPPPGACHCWHREDQHGVCVEAGCACGGEFRRPVFGWLTLGLAVLRGGA